MPARDLSDSDLSRQVAGIVAKKEQAPKRPVALWLIVAFSVLTVVGLVLGLVNVQRQNDANARSAAESKTRNAQTQQLAQCINDGLAGRTATTKQQSDSDVRWTKAQGTQAKEQARGLALIAAGQGEAGFKVIQAAAVAFAQAEVIRENELAAIAAYRLAHPLGGLHLMPTYQTPDALDFSGARPGGALLADRGIKVVCRYLSRSLWKNLTSAEIVDYHAHGVGILLNWEAGQTNALQGRAQGLNDGTAAMNQAIKLGAPRGRTIYFSVDTDTTPGDYAAVDAYFRGVAAAFNGAFKIGVYGEYDLVRHLHDAGLVSSEWQAFAWSHGQQYPGAELYQFRNSQWGGTVDYDKILNPAGLGAWWSPAWNPELPPKPPVVTPPPVVVEPQQPPVKPTEPSKPTVPVVTFQEGDMIVVSTDSPDIGVLNADYGYRHLTPAQWKAVLAAQAAQQAQGLISETPKRLKLPIAIINDLPPGGVMTSIVQIKIPVIKDVAERALWTFAETFFPLVVTFLLGGTDLTHWAAWEKVLASAALAGVSAAFAVVKGAIAAASDPQSGASTAKAEAVPVETDPYAPGHTLAEFGPGNGFSDADMQEARNG